MAYSGRYKVKNPKKYRGDVKDVVYRSLWELYCFKWCDKNPDVTEWSSEEVVIPYKYEATDTYHRYFVDLYMEWKGKKYIIEIKPKKETIKPNYPGRKTKRYLEESLTFVKNQNKWQAAEAFAKKRGWKFEVWTEDTLRALKIMKTKPLPTINKTKQRKK